MSFRSLLHFIEQDMRMSHVYQPVMLRTLLANGGQANTAEIAADLLAEDRAQQEYYAALVKNMVGQVLAKRDLVARDGDTWRLEGAEQFTKQEAATLLAACDRKLAEYAERRGDRIWDHRRRSTGYISGTLRYEVLKAAQFRCELCGVPADERALEVDHIVPRNKGGVDDRTNLQALCYSCNAMKRDRDDTDLRAVRASYAHSPENCPFCQVPDPLAANHLAIALWDRHPVTPLHALVMPRRHVADLWGMSEPEIRACHQLLHTLRGEIQGRDPTVAGFNVGVNAGGAAGQTVHHAHFHLIPGREGDVEHPLGGIRCVIPGKGAY